MTPTAATATRASGRRAGGAGGRGGATAVGMVLALVRRDLGDPRQFRLPLLLDVAFGVVNLVVFLFISRVLTPATGTDLTRSPSYFDFVAVGITFLLVLQAASTQLTGRVIREQRSGTLELLAAQPVPVPALAIGTAGYPFLFVLLRSGVYLAILATVLGLRTEHADWWGVTVVLVAGSAAMMGVGIVLAAFTIAVGHGDGAARLVVVGLSFVSGTYFPVSELPGPLPALTAVLPSRIALDGLRAALTGGHWTWSAGALLGATALLLPASSWAFGRALRVAARRGALKRD
ncbi:ABC transporter permease [Micromonospora lupini]|uniref:ABC transporter permease n=1 Tax=Micromonospora lupini TaxID=285679 RepID=UPI002255D488|nr:ABC transporter permease [Micromonospora lupini]MCX5065099.1 ABC transporter permease [Micromonospora lupini]